jgi:phosphoglycolate phosphatase
LIKLIFDLDGTLIDSKPRLYHLFQHLVPASKLSYDDYWVFKQNKVSNEAILANEFGYDEVAIKNFVANWMKYIESPEFLEFDKIIPRVKETLDRLSKQAELHVCTARQFRQSTIEQIDGLGLLSYFNTIMVTEQKKRKDDLIFDYVSGLSPKDWMIGDTGKDIQVGHALGIKTCGVLSGFLSEKSLRPYKPDLIFSSVADFEFFNLNNN